MNAQLLAVFGVFWATTAVANPPAPDAGASEPKSDETGATKAPPPSFEDKVPIGTADLKRKKTRSVVTGLPLANFDTNTGVGGGVRLYYYFNGDRNDPLFAYTPYLHRVFVQAFFTSKGVQGHWLDYDSPAVLGTPFRLRAQLFYLRNTEQHFFGIGERSLDRLTFTGADRTYGDYGDYKDELQRVRSDGTTLARYNDYDMERPFLFLSLERSLLRGRLRPLIGLGFNYANINDYTGERVDTDNGRAEMGTTLLREECDMGQLIGCAGGWDNVLRLALAFDTRDFEPDPNGGVFADMSLDLGTAVLGSRYDYWRFLVSARYFRSIAPSLTDLVAAVRFTFQTQSAGTPFFSLNSIPWTEDPRTGIGGHRTLRGFRQDRFVGRHFSLLNLELRWTFHRFEVLGQRFALGTVAFLDTGRVYDRLQDLTFRRWRNGQGLGFRATWNQATIISVDYGISAEDTGLYINFAHQF